MNMGIKVTPGFNEKKVSYTEMPAGILPTNNIRLRDLAPDPGPGEENRDWAASRTVDRGRIQDDGQR
jgi:hypothetical protein